ncbi:MAG: SpoIIIAC/SpoIIIAD family protein [Clostridia bacterium]|nr:SpoIIIAC/SpoIIIAD family protein [Clostridia bacterium]
MDITKIAAIAITSTLIIILLKGKKPIFAALVALAATAVMAIYTIDGLSEIFTSFERLFETGGIEPVYYKSVIKVIGIAYFTEITSALCRDAGETAIAQKLELAGRVAVLMFTMPAVTQLMTVIIEALNLI